MTMIEKMARAICAEDPFVSTKGALPWDDLSKHGKDRLRKNARAALTALLEPNEGMLRAGSLNGSYPEDLNTYDLMISFALSEDAS